MSDSRPCHVLSRRELVERIARQIRTNGALIDSRVKPGTCCLCFTAREHSYRVLEQSGGTSGGTKRVRYVTAGSDEEREVLEAEEKRDPVEFWVMPLRLCPVAEDEGLYAQARRLNADRAREKGANSPGNEKRGFTKVGGYE